MKKFWTIFGDFKVVLQSKDRLGGNPVTLVELTEFQKWLDVCVLEEMASTGCTYTQNNKGGHSKVYSKIDWVFMNAKWLDEILVEQLNVFQDIINGAADEAIS